MAGGNLLSTALNMAAGFITARLVAPEIMGRYVGISLFAGYAIFLQGGALNGLNRELPFYIGRNKIDRVLHLIAAAQWWAMITSTFASLLFLIMAVYYLYIGQLSMAIGWIANSLGVFVTIFSSQYLKSTYRTNNEFRKLTIVEIFKSVVNNFSLIFIYYFGFIGICIRTSLVFITDIALLWRWRSFKVNSKFSKAHLVHLFKIGLPNFAVGYLDILWSTLSATLILFLAGEKSLGLFTVSLITFNTSEILTNSLNQIIYPKLSEKFGNGMNVGEMIKFSIKPGIYIFVLMSIISVITYYLLPYVVSFIIPKYVEGIDAARWMLPITVVMSLSTLNHVFIVAKKQHIYAIAKLIGMAVHIVSIYFIYNYSKELTSFSISLLLGKTVFMGLCIFFAFYSLDKNQKSV
jgi:O-antigen/teichoic acid export membrane protein